MVASRYSVAIVAAEIVFAVLTTLVLILRIVSRKLSKAGLWHDDRLIIAAYPLAMLLFIAFTIAGLRGAGASNPDVKFIRAVFYLGSFAYFTCIALTKLSVLWFYHRVFTRSRHFTHALLITGILVCLWWIAFIPVVITVCWPIKISPFPDASSKCFSILHTLIGNTIPSLLLDLTILILPLRPLWKLQMARRQKTALTITFVLGYLNPAISIVRLTVIIQFGSMVDNHKYFITSFILWNTAGLAIGIISSSIPSLAYLFRRALRSSEIADKNNFSKDRDYSKLPLNRGAACIPEGLEETSLDSFQHKDNKSVYNTHSHWYVSAAQPEKRDVMPDLGDRIRVARSIDINVHEVSWEHLATRHCATPPLA